MDEGVSDQLPGEPQPRGSIGRRITTLVAVAVTLSVCLATITFVSVQAWDGVAGRRQALEGAAYVLASAIGENVAVDDRDGALRGLRAIRHMPEIDYVHVTGRNGRELASLGSAVLIDDDIFQPGGNAFSFLFSGSLPVSIAIVSGGKEVGALLIIADISDLRRRIGLALLATLLVALLASIAGVTVARRLQRRITTPIQKLTAAMIRVGETKRYDKGMEDHADGETGLLIDASNRMMAEIRMRDQALEGSRQTLEMKVTERTRQLKTAKEAAEVANRAKSDFLATMTHEIRTPMNGLMVMAELLNAANLGPRQQRYAEIVLKSGQGLLSIINDLLDLSKIEAGKLELEKIPVDPTTIADDVVGLFWEHAAGKGLDLAARSSPAVPRKVLADPVRLNQILTNLTNNALKFTETGQVLISLHFEAGRLVIAVADSGIGIRREKIDRLFEAFTQADQSTTRRYGGTGLGLTICRRLVDAMGGVITVQSEFGKGSIFRVSIPVDVAEPARPAAVSGGRRAAVTGGGKATVSALGTALLGRGFDVSLAVNGAPPDLLLCPPEEAGAWRSAVGGDRRIVCLSRRGDAAGDAAVMGGIADGVLVLPFCHRELDELLAALAAGRRVTSAGETAGAAGSLADQGLVGRRVLVADDNVINREVIIEVLLQLGMAVESVENGREAVEAWRRLKPDFIFMDCSMPEMDGYEATREIRAHERLDVAADPVPIVALTANAAGASRDDWREAGMNDYITKPFTVGQIAACLRRHLATGEPAALALPASGGDEDVVIDDAVIGDLRQIGGSEALFRRVLDLFVSRVPLAVDRIQSVASTSDLKAMADAAHALKSMCANVGARRAAAACDRLETAARRNEAFDAGALTATIIAEVRAVMNRLEDLRAA